VSPGVLNPCGNIFVRWERGELGDASQRILLWFTNRPSGRFPETGMMKLRLYKSGEAYFKGQ
jgi:hypothetical protein